MDTECKVGVQVETKLAIATIVSRFQIAIDVDKMSWRRPEDMTHTVQTLITLRQPGGVHLRLRPRVPLSQAAVTSAGNGTETDSA